MNRVLQNLIEELFDLCDVNTCDIGTSKECSKAKSWECSYCENKYPSFIEDNFILKLLCLLHKYELKDGIVEDYEETKKNIVAISISFLKCEAPCVLPEEQETFKKEVREIFKN